MKESVVFKAGDWGEVAEAAQECAESMKNLHELLEKEEEPMGNEREKYPKSKFRYVVNVVRTEEDEEGNKRFKIVDTKISSMSGKRYFEMCRLANREPLIVHQKPVEFQINEQYMLATRDVVWTWTEEE